MGLTEIQVKALKGISEAQAAHSLATQGPNELPTAWDGFRMQRSYRGARYAISVRRAHPGEPAGWTANGIRLAGSTLPYAASGGEVQVEGCVA